VKYKSLFNKAIGGVLTTIGFLLSPLSWWNDLVVNFPLSYVIALPFGLIKESLFLPSFISAYWLTNILGLVLMQKGGQKLFKPEEMQIEPKKRIKNTLIWSSVYTVLIVILILSGVLTFPSELMVNK
jgi:hypothetical protein